MSQDVELRAVRDRDGTSIVATRADGIASDVQIRAERGVDHQHPEIAVVVEMRVSGIAYDGTDAQWHAIVGALRSRLDYEARRFAAPIWCGEIAERYGWEHCTSCHHEWDHGYGEPRIWRLPDGQTVKSCCAVAIAAEARGIKRDYYDGGSVTERI